SPLSTSRISVAVHRRLEPDALQFLQPPTTGSTVPLLSVSCPASRPPPGFQCAIFHVRLHISTPSAPPSARIRFNFGVFKLAFEAKFRTVYYGLKLHVLLVLIHRVVLVECELIIVSKLS
ncbi:hypothetical protein Csa_023127, partial [Cucumis sativus]